MPEPYNVYTTQKADEIFPKGSRANEKDGDLWTYDAVSGAYIAKAPVPPAPSMPSGAILEYGGSSAPSGYLLCNGAAVSRTTHAALFAVLGTTYGAGDGSTTFALPDMRGRVPMGAGTGTGLTARTRGQQVGSESVALTVEQMPAHDHTYNDDNYGIANNTTASGVGARLTAANQFTARTGSSGAGEGHPNIPPALVLNYIIKT